MISQGRAVGVIGIGRMARHFIQILVDAGAVVHVYNRTESKLKDYHKQIDRRSQIVLHTSPHSLMAALGERRLVLISVSAGTAIDDVLENISPLLRAEDVVVDLGNTSWMDSARRGQKIGALGAHFVACGMLYPEHAFEQGGVILAGGSIEGFQDSRDVLNLFTARNGASWSCGYIGHGGAGSQAKMLSIGLEYALVALLCETYDVLRSILCLSPERISEIFLNWNSDSNNEAELLCIAAEVLGKRDDETGQPLVDVIVDRAEQLGIGNTCVRTGFEMGVPLTIVAEAVLSRCLSMRGKWRTGVEAALDRPSNDSVVSMTIEDVRSAYLCARAACHWQILDMAHQMGQRYEWAIGPRELSGLWSRGATISSALLTELSVSDYPEAEGTLLPPAALALCMNEGAPGLRTVVAEAAMTGLGLPCLAAAQTFIDSASRTLGPAGLIQGMRDLWGAHPFERFDRGGLHHGPWG